MFPVLTMIIVLKRESAIGILLLHCELQVWMNFAEPHQRKPTPSAPGGLGEGSGCGDNLVEVLRSGGTFDPAQVQNVVVVNKQTTSRLSLGSCLESCRVNTT